MPPNQEALPAQRPAAKPPKPVKPAKLVSGPRGRQADGGEPHRCPKGAECHRAHVPIPREVLTSKAAADAWLQRNGWAPGPGPATQA